jgi:uncharacterized protein
MTDKRIHRSGDSRASAPTRRVDYLGVITYVEDVEDPKHRSDSRSNITAHMTPEGYLKVEGRISGTGVYEYQDMEGNTWGELRAPEHVFEPEAMASFALKPVTDDHPPVMVDATNIQEYQAGQLGSKIVPDGDYLRADMLITDPELIERIKLGKTQLSCGYTVIAVPESGTYDGKPYEYIQTTIRGNHLSVVDEARGGPECRLLLDNSAGSRYHEPNPKPKDNVMKVKDGKIVVGESEFDLPDEVSAMIEQLKSKVEEQGAELAKLAAEGDSKDEEPMEEEKPEVEVEAKDATAALRAQVDALKAQLEAIKADQSAKIDARVNLVSQAKEVVPGIKTDGVKDLDIMKAVVAAALPAMAAKVKDSKSPEYVKAAYDAALEAHRSQVDSSKELLDLTFRAHADNKPVDLDSLYRSYQDGLKTRVERN